MDQCAIENLLWDLPGTEPDAARTARTRARCHKTMNRPVAHRRLESVIVGSFCVAYVTIGAVLALYYRGLI
jgi:hypothetical protein